MENQNKNEEKFVNSESVSVNKKPTGISLPSAIVLAAVILGGSILLSQRSSVTAGVGSDTQDIAIPEVTEDDFIKGDPNAEITLIEYADFSCGFCAKYHPTMERLVEEYDGKVRWVYRHLPIFNKPAAISSQCVGNILGDEKFFEYSDVLYQNQKELNSELMKKEALALGVDENDYESCVNDFKISDKISRDFTSVRVLAGINSTPHTIIVDKNGKKYPFSGALPYEDVATLVDSFLK